jgi:hypothetical protein
MRQRAKFQIRQQFQKGFMYDSEETAEVKNIYQLYIYIYSHSGCMGYKTVETNGVTIIDTVMTAVKKSGNVATVNIFESTSDVMYIEYEYTYEKKSHTRITYISEQIKFVQ